MNELETSRGWEVDQAPVLLSSNPHARPLPLGVDTMEKSFSDSADRLLEQITFACRDLLIMLTPVQIARRLRSAIAIAV